MVECNFFLENSESQKIELPLDWNEFDFAELKIIVKALTSNTPKPVLGMNILAYRMQKNRVKNIELFQLDDDDLVNELLPLVDHWLENINLTKNPQLKLDDFLSLPNFDSMLVGEYEEADINYILYNEYKNPQHLIALAQGLWRPVIDGKRATAEGYEYSGSFFQKLSELKLQLIYLWFTGCRNELLSLFPNIFGRNDNPDETTDTEQNNEQQALGITDLIHAAAGERNGTRREIRWKTSIKEFLYDCQLQQEQHEEWLVNMKKNDS